MGRVGVTRMDTMSAVYTLSELWMLRAYIRHEMSGQREWQYPPASIELNDQITEAILICEDQGQSEAALTLTRGDCLAIDAVIPQDAKDADGKPVGRAILLKTMRVRHALSDTLRATIEEPDYTREQRVIKAVTEANHATTDDDPHNDADN